MSKYLPVLLVALLLIQPAFTLNDSSAQDMINYQKELRENLTRQINQTRAEMQKILEQMNQTKAELERQRQIIESQNALKRQLEEQRQKALELQFQDSINRQREEINSSIAELKIEKKEIYESYIRMKVAAISLMIAKQSLNEIPENVSAAAAEINISIDETVESEQKIDQRNFVVRMIIGGDRQSAGQIEEAVAKNMERISAIENALENISYSDSIKALLEGQLQVLKKDQERLLKLAEEENKDYGLIGWLWQ